MISFCYLLKSNIPKRTSTISYNLVINCISLVFPSLRRYPVMVDGHDSGKVYNDKNVKNIKFVGRRHEKKTCSNWQQSNIPIVTWSTTERREIRNFPYPSVFELTGCQRLTIKRGIRNVVQLRPACRRK